MTKIKIGSFVVALLLCLSSLALGQERTGSIEGTIKDAQERSYRVPL
jgi:hypothetical protein